MLTLGNPAHTLLYFLPASELIGVTVIHPTDVSGTERSYYTVDEFMAAIGPQPDDDVAGGLAIITANALIETLETQAAAS